MRRVERLTAALALLVAAYSGTQAVLADGGGSGCQASVYPNGSITCMANPDCDNGCAVVAVPAPPPYTGWSASNCNCSDYFGGTSYCNAAPIFNASGAFVAVYCASDEFPQMCADTDKTCKLYGGPGTGIPWVCLCM